MPNTEPDVEDYEPAERKTERRQSIDMPTLDQDSENKKQKNAATTGWAKSQVPFFSHKKLAHVLSNFLVSVNAF